MRRHTGDKSSGSTGPVAQSDQPPAIANLNTTPPQGVVGIIPYPYYLLIMPNSTNQEVSGWLIFQRRVNDLETQGVDRQANATQSCTPPSGDCGTMVPHDVEVLPYSIKQEECDGPRIVDDPETQGHGSQPGETYRSSTVPNDVDIQLDLIRQEEDECGGPMEAVDSGCNQQDADTERPHSGSNVNISEGSFAKSDLMSEKPFRCLECGKGFPKGSRLKEHVLTGRQMRLRVVPLPPVAVALWCHMMSKFCLTLSSKRSAMGQESSTIQKPKVTARSQVRLIEVLLFQMMSIFSRT
ncbi:Hypothetical protein NTJ_12322 [Nesidiocoris tenuis]|uniref:C2H2-type domain-containing protein n=1 Tax=Nesidiocoris tenuis TaxID=355587 RepID=A0ABN7B521_9HEMI|nr:Hypothetical protein NTJ_12322 [Nesidiocoris tenuis]